MANEKEREQAAIDAADAEFRAKWEAEQRAAYPDIYREADKVKQQIEADAAQAEANRQRIVGMEPGHDPTRQAANLDDHELIAGTAATAGDDNRAPHETTPQAVTSTPNPPVVDPTATVEVETETETEPAAPKGKK